MAQRVEFENMDPKTRTEATVEILAARTRAMADLFPQSQSTFERIAGGCVASCGADSMHNYACGIGSAGKVSEEELDALEDFFRVRGSPISLLVTPPTDPSLISMLTKRGYVRGRSRRDWWRPTVGYEPHVGDEQVSVVPVVPGNTENWARLAAQGFDEGRIGDILAMAQAQGAYPFLALYGKEHVGAALLTIYKDVGYLSTATTLDSHRGKGVHKALIAERLKHAFEASCKTVFATTDPKESISEKNLAYFGFMLLDEMWFVSR